MHFTKFLLPVFLLALSGCVDRQDADSKMIRACAAGVKEFLDGKYDEIIGPNDSSAGLSSAGRDFREIAVKFTVGDGWVSKSREYKCVFQESFSFLRGSHTASIHNIQLGDRYIGQYQGTIYGDMEDHARLSQVVNEAMYGSE